MSVIVKAAASAVKVLGALVGGVGDELSFVAFTPDSTNLVEGEAEKLTDLAATHAGLCRIGWCSKAKLSLNRASPRALAVPSSLAGFPSWTLRDALLACAA